MTTSEPVSVPRPQASAAGGGHRRSLMRLLHPRSVAVVGATDRPGSYGAQALLNLEQVGFPGPVWGVNPRRDQVLGRDCVPSVAQLPEPVDALVVAIPAAGVPDVIEQAGARGCGGAVVFSSGFAEVRSGIALQQRLVRSARRHGLAVCGPNCNGILVPSRRLALWGDMLPASAPGPVALISQSGNVAVNALASQRGLRLHTVIAAGNQALTSAGDYLELLVAEDGVGAVALYLEDDGGPRLVSALAAAAEAQIPVVVLKVGSSAAGARAAAAHSGALAGDQRVFAALVREAGAVLAADVHELLELAKVIAVRRGARRSGPGGAGCGRRLAIMTCSGGDSAQAADEAERLGLKLPDLAPSTCAALAALLPPTAAAANPLDYTTALWGQRRSLAELVRTLGEDPGVDQLVVLFDQPEGLAGELERAWTETREGLAAGAALSPVPTLVSSTLPELLDDQVAERLQKAGIATAAGLRTGLRCAAALALLGQAVGEDHERRAARLRAIAQVASSRGARHRLDAGGAQRSGWLAEHEAKRLLRSAGVAVPEGRPVASATQACSFWRQLGGPIALKLSAAAVRHKSELGGVRLGLDGEPQISAAFAEIAALAQAHGGVVLAERMEGPGLELIVAAHRRGVVPALVLGLGGIWAELLDDVVVLPLPADAGLIAQALRRLRGAPLLFGARGQRAVDVDAVAALAQRLGELMLEDELQLVECNPVLARVDGGGALVLDAIIERVSGDGAAL